jgi:cytochrome c
MHRTMKPERRLRHLMLGALSALVLTVVLAACGDTADEAEFGSDPSAAPKVAVAAPASVPETAAPAAEPVATEAPVAEPVAEAPAAPEAAGAVDVAAAESLFVGRGCGACHTVSGILSAVGTIGPDLDGMASRPQIAETLDTSLDNFRTWLADPPAAKPGTAMPNLGMSAEDVDLLAAWLMTLQ